MSAPIDPALFSPFDGKEGAQPQAYASQPQQNVGHPYYLPASAPQPLRAQLSQPPPPPALSSNIDASLQQTSPQVPEGSHDEYDHDHDHDHEQDDDGDHDGAHATPGSAKDAGDFKRPRACDSCRGLKVRCDQERPDVSCKRCAKAGRPWYAYKTAGFQCDVE